MNNYAEIEKHCKLQLAISHPSLEESWIDGYEAAKANQDESQNPYQSHTRAHQHWLDGWWDANFGEEPLFSLDTELSTDACAKATEIANEKVAINWTLWLHHFIQLTFALLFAMICYELVDLAS